MQKKICWSCIVAIKSHGESIFIGDEVDYDEYVCTHGNEAVCDWCADDGVELREVIFR